MRNENRAAAIKMGNRQAELCLPNGYRRVMAAHDAERIANQANDTYERVEKYNGYHL